jgi:hypothetical protein
MSVLENSLITTPHSDPEHMGMEKHNEEFPEHTRVEATAGAPDGGLLAWSVVAGAWCTSFCSFGWLNSKCSPLHPGAQRPTIIVSSRCGHISRVLPEGFSKATFVQHNCLDTLPPGVLHASIGEQPRQGLSLS